LGSDVVGTGSLREDLIHLLRGELAIALLFDAVDERDVTPIGASPWYSV
jgi:hypothetical protein